MESRVRNSLLIAKFLLSCRSGVAVANHVCNRGGKNLQTSSTYFTRSCLSVTHCVRIDNRGTEENSMVSFYKAIFVALGSCDWMFVEKALIKLKRGELKLLITS